MEAEQIKTSFWNFTGAVDYVDDWFLMGSPFPMLSILVSYLFFVLKCGPKFMEKRQPYELKNTLLIYNVFQVLYSCYLFNIGTRFLLDYGLLENGFCATDDENIKYRLLSAHYLYFVAKLSELLDTIFFVMRKKWNQVSFLHVYHHSFMFFLTWVTLKYETSYTFVFTGNINCFVHIIMYGYYGLSAFPGLEKYLWWKKYITKMQLIQFGLILLQITWSYFVTTCPTSNFLITVAWSHVFLFIYLFTRFYNQSYSQKEKGSRKVKNVRIKENKGSAYALHSLTRRDDNYNEVKDKKR